MRSHNSPFGGDVRVGVDLAAEKEHASFFISGRAQTQQSAGTSPESGTRAGRT